MTVGGLDSSLYTGSVTYTKVTLEGYWEVETEGIAINGTTVSGTSSLAAIDTGTSLWYVPSAVAEALFAQLGGEAYSDQGYYSIPCDAHTFTVSAVFSGVQFQVDLSDMLLGYADSSHTQCVFGIVAQDNEDTHGNQMAIIGDAFLKNVYSVFDYSNGQVGFATLTNTSSSSTRNTAGSGVTATASAGSKSTSTADKSAGTSLHTSLFIVFTCLMAAVAVVAY